MKKTLFLLVIAATAMTGCVKSEVLEVAENRVIEFDSFVGKHTKAAENQIATIIGTRSELTEFYVYGNNGSGKVFDGAKVYYTGDAQNGHYTYDGGAKVWLTGHTYYFAAVSDGNSNVSNVTYNGTESNNTLTIDDYNVGLNDLIADIADPVNTSGSMVGKETVTFDFRHLLTRVRFVVNNDVSTENSVVVVKDLKFEGVKEADCVYTLTQDSNAKNYTHSYNWDISGKAAQIYQYTDATIEAPNVSTVDAGKFYIKPGQSKQFGHFVIPQTSQRKVSFKLETYTLTEGGSYQLTDTKDYTYDLDYDNDLTASNSDDFLWQPGKVYQYAIKVAGTTSYIRFDATVQGWNWDINADGSSNSSDDIQIAN